MTKSKSFSSKTIRNIILIVISAIILFLLVILGMCLFIERPAEQAVAVYQSDFVDTLILENEDGDVEILPQEKENIEAGIIFYVGAQIRPNAYIPLFARLAERGYACFIPDLPFNTAPLEADAAEVIISSHPEIGSWFLGGHSLGGFAAAGFAAEHCDEIDGLILLAAYAEKDMSDADLPTLSILGDNDGVLNRSLYEKRRSWNSSDFEEHIIPGGNHAQFGDYGKQPRDYDASISAQEQQVQTAEIILDWINRQK